MNLNLHAVSSAIATPGVRLDMEPLAYAALVAGTSDVPALFAMAELVDWELADSGELSGLGLRCKRALQQRLLQQEDGRALEALASRSGVVNELFHSLTAAAESLAVSFRLAA